MQSFWPQPRRLCSIRICCSQTSNTRCGRQTEGISSDWIISFGRRSQYVGNWTALVDAWSLQALCIQSTLWRGCIEGSPETQTCPEDMFDPPRVKGFYVKNQSKRRNCLYHECKKKFILFYDCCVVKEYKATTYFNCPTTCSSSRGEHKCYHQRRMSNTHLQFGKHRYQISHIDMKDHLWPLLCHFPVQELVQWLSVPSVKIHFYIKTCTTDPVVWSSLWDFFGSAVHLDVSFKLWCGSNKPTHPPENVDIQRTNEWKRCSVEHSAFWVKK